MRESLSDKNKQKYFLTITYRSLAIGTPNHNIGAMRIKEKLQIREIDLQLKVPSLLRDGISCRYFELTAEEPSKKLETFGL
jgi:hypothetical protein